MWYRKEISFIFYKDIPELYTRGYQDLNTSTYGLDGGGDWFMEFFGLSMHICIPENVDPQASVGVPPRKNSGWNGKIK
jgi:hypothetical protein